MERCEEARAEAIEGLGRAHRDAIRFEQLVRDMRTAQKRYFATREKHHLIESKKLEGLVDKMLKEEEE